MTHEQQRSDLTAATRICVNTVLSPLCSLPILQVRKLRSVDPKKNIKQWGNGREVRLPWSSC